MNWEQRQSIFQKKMAYKYNKERERIFDPKYIRSVKASRKRMAWRKGWII